MNDMFTVSDAAQRSLKFVHALHGKEKPCVNICSLSMFYRPNYGGKRPNTFLILSLCLALFHSDSTLLQGLRAARERSTHAHQSRD